MTTIYKRFGITIVAAIFALSAAACKDVAGLINNEVPSVGSVSVSPADTSVKRGGTLSFTATVTGENNPAQTVNWTIDETVVEGTAIDNNGTLTVAADETLASLTVRAASTADKTKSGTAAVTVENASATVSSVTVEPASATVQKRRSYTFSASVIGENGPSQAVIWTIDETAAEGTAIDDSGTLTVAADETLASLTVRAASTIDPGKSGTATVDIIEYIPPSVSEVRVNPASATVQKKRSVTFSASVIGENGPSPAVTWTIDETAAEGTSIGVNGTLTVAADETLTSLTVRATSVEDDAKSGTAAVTIVEYIPPRVSKVTVTPDSATVTKGKTQTFSASVIGENGPSPAVTWTIDETVAEGTSIGVNGTLTVAADETLTSLTVRATSVEDDTKSGTAAVTVEEVPSTGNSVIGELSGTTWEYIVPYLNLVASDITFSGSEFTLRIMPEFPSTPENAITGTYTVTDKAVICTALWVSDDERFFEDDPPPSIGEKWTLRIIDVNNIIGDEGTDEPKKYTRSDGTGDGSSDGEIGELSGTIWECYKTFFVASDITFSGSEFTLRVMLEFLEPLEDVITGTYTVTGTHVICKVEWVSADLRLFKDGPPPPVGAEWKLRIIDANNIIGDEGTDDPKKYTRKK